MPFGDFQPYDPRFNANKYPIHDYFFAAALKRVRPGGLIAYHQLGSAWIPEKDVEWFAQELLDLPSSQSVQIRHLPEMGSWAVQSDYQAKASVANTTEWGTAGFRYAF